MESIKGWLALIATMAFLSGIAALVLPAAGTALALVTGSTALFVLLRHEPGTEATRASSRQAQGAERDPAAQRSLASRSQEPPPAQYPIVSSNPPPPDSEQGLVGYQRLERLASGSMGELWLVRHRQLERVAVLKQIRGTRVKPEDIGRFTREAQVLSSLHCPHTIQVFDFGIGAKGHPYYVMEFLEGIDLQTLVCERGPLPPERVVHILQQVCLSLAEAHEAGLVHRDIKPANVMLCRYGTTRDFVKLLDFGLVKREAREHSISLTSPAVVLGTPAYVAPESLKGSKYVDGRADLYAVGAIGFFLLTGRLLFDHDQPVAMAKAHLSEPAPRASKWLPSLPRALDDLLDECLRKDPAGRPQTAEAMRERLAALGLPRWSEEQARRCWADYGPLLKKPVLEAKS